MQPPLRFDADYCEDVPLDDGASINLRLLTRHDRDALLAAYHSLSDPSRYRRFHRIKPDLSDEELDFFTDVDGWNHLALAAFTRSRDGYEKLVGVARFLRIPPGGSIAEVSLGVIDPMQGKGLGKLMLNRLVEAAAERGVRRLRFYLLENNRSTQTLLAASAWETNFEDDSTIVAADLMVPEATPLANDDGVDEALEDKLAELIRMIARGAIVTPISLSLVGVKSWMSETRRLVALLSEPAAVAG